MMNQSEQVKNNEAMRERAGPVLGQKKATSVLSSQYLTSNKNPLASKASPYQSNNSRMDVQVWLDK
jgi:hypothetical protein